MVALPSTLSPVLLKLTWKCRNGMPKRNPDGQGRKGVGFGGDLDISERSPCENQYGYVDGQA